MMGPIEQLLSVSARLYKHLEEIPDVEGRDSYIEAINDLLEKRGQIIELLKVSEEFSLEKHQLTPHLLELDTGIKERLKNVMAVIKIDIKNLQNSKKTEQQYLNPYSNVQVMDGMYFDNKK